MDELFSDLNKTKFGQDLGPETEFDLYLCMTLTFKVKLLNLAKIVITFLVMDIFDWHLDKITHMTKPTFLFLQVILKKSSVAPFAELPVCPSVYLFLYTCIN